MKFSKIVLAILLILAITATFVACTPTDTTGPSNDDQTGQTPGDGGSGDGGSGDGGSGDEGGDEGGSGSGEQEPTGAFSITFRRSGSGKCVVSGFNGKGEGEIVIPATKTINGEECAVVGIEAGAFRNCKYITSIVVPDTVTSIGLGAFEGCVALEEITLPFVGGSATSQTFIGYIFGAETFAANASCVPATLATVNLSDACTSVAAFAFDSCTGIKAVNLGNAVSSIGSYAFARCGLTEISLPDSLASVGIGAYVGCPVTKAALPFVGADSTGDIGYLGYIFGASDYAENKDFVPETLKEITVSTVCTTIGAGAFNDCEMLESIDLPNTVVSIGENAFTNTPYFNEKPEGLVYIGSVLYTYKGELGDHTDIVVAPGTIAIAAGAFDGMGITSVSIPESVVNIGLGAFGGSQLTEITLPFVGESDGAAENNHFGYIFGAATADENGTYIPATLKTVNLYDGCTTIGTRAFYGCAGLEAVNVGAGVSSIAKDAFFECTTLSDITIAAGNESYKNDSKLVYNAAGDDLVAVPMAVTGEITLLNITEIGEGQFRNCAGITSVVLPQTLVTIGKQAFYGVESLSDITFPASLAGVGAGAFEGTGWFNNQPDGVVYTGNVLYKFKGESGAEIKVLDTVTGIAAGAFENCNIVSIEIPASVTNIGEGAFRNCQLQALTVPFIGATADDTETSFIGYFFGAPSATVAYRDIPATLKSITVLEGCTTIGSGAFNGCTSVEELVLPSTITHVAGGALNQTAWYANQPGGVLYVGRVAYAFVKPEMTYQEYENAIAAQPEGEEPIVNPYKVILRADTVAIADDAFNKAAIVSIRIPDTTLSIGANAFYGCTALTKVRMSSYLEILGEAAFYGCTSLGEIYIPGTVEHISAYAFRGCSRMLSATFGKGIKSIGASAFSNCNAFRTFYYTGDMLEWMEVDIPDSNTELFAARDPSYDYYYVPEPFEVTEEE